MNKSKPVVGEEMGKREERCVKLNYRCFTVLVQSRLVVQ